MHEAALFNKLFLTYQKKKWPTIILEPFEDEVIICLPILFLWMTTGVFIWNWLEMCGTNKKVSSLIFEIMERLRSYALKWLYGRCITYWLVSYYTHLEGFEPVTLGTCSYKGRRCHLSWSSLATHIIGKSHKHTQKIRFWTLEPYPLLGGGGAIWAGVHWLHFIIGESHKHKNFGFEPKNLTLCMVEEVPFEPELIDFYGRLFFCAAMIIINIISRFY